MGYITRLRKQRAQVSISVNAKTLCQKLEIDPSKIKGTGKKGKVTVKDVNKYMAAQVEVAVPSIPEPVQPKTETDEEE